MTFLKVLLVLNALFAVINMTAGNYGVMTLNIVGFLAILFTLPTLPEEGE